MRSNVPKVMHKIAGKAMISHVLDTAAELEPKSMITVLGNDIDDVAQALPEHVGTAIQQEQLGTGHAVQSVESALSEFEGIVFILYGDTPLISASTLRKMQAAMVDADVAVTVLGMEPVDPSHYGRLITSGDGDLQAIVEFKDATEEQKQIRLCNSGVMAVKAPALFEYLSKVDNNNAKGEYYLTDIVAIARDVGARAKVVTAHEDELIGVNSKAELAQAELIYQQRLRQAAMESGVMMHDPSTVWLSHDTIFGKNVEIQPNVFFGTGVTIGDGVEIRSFSHFEQTTIGNNVMIGPFARLRPGAELANDVCIGNFVEIKKATLAKGAKVNHLSYVGDAKVGEEANLGAGTITCNYDGFHKHQTVIGKGAFVGSNSALVAPVVIGDGAIVGAGSVIREDVSANAIATARADQTEKAEEAVNFRKKRA
jgi:bifunctional UDP-N-acetylglucosamine pyrophosphorylase/glucosamine-1-phosphate N-acetyltransferase